MRLYFPSNALSNLSLLFSFFYKHTVTPWISVITHIVLYKPAFHVFTFFSFHLWDYCDRCRSNQLRFPFLCVSFLLPSRLRVSKSCCISFWTDFFSAGAAVNDVLAQGLRQWIVAWLRPLHTDIVVTSYSVCHIARKVTYLTISVLIYHIKHRNMTLN